MALSITGLVGSAVATAAGGYARAVETVDYVQRMATKAETLLDETLDAVRAARPVLEAVSAAVDDGLIDDVRNTLHEMERTVNLVGRVSTQIDQSLPRLDSTVHHLGTTLPLVDRTAKAMHAATPAITALPAAQEEMRLAREATEHLAGLLATAIEQVEMLPGARMVRRRLARPPADDELPLELTD